MSSNTAYGVDKSDNNLLSLVSTARSVDPLCTEFLQHRKHGANWTMNTDTCDRVGGCLIILRLEIEALPNTNINEIKCSGRPTLIIPMEA